MVYEEGYIFLPNFDNKANYYIIHSFSQLIWTPWQVQTICKWLWDVARICVPEGGCDAWLANWLYPWLAGGLISADFVPSFAKETIGHPWTCDRAQSTVFLSLWGETYSFLMLCLSACLAHIFPICFSTLPLPCAHFASLTCLCHEWFFISFLDLDYFHFSPLLHITLKTLSFFGNQLSHSLMAGLTISILPCLNGWPDHSLFPQSNGWPGHSL